MGVLTDLTGARDNLVLSPSGWADYRDDTYTSESPLQLLADTPTVLTNDAAHSLTRTDYLPDDTDGFYDIDNGLILGQIGDGYILTLEFTAKPTNVNTTYLEHWIDIGGSIGELYRRPITFPKGNGVERRVTTSTAYYTLDTWAANGGTVYVQAVNTCDIYDIRFVIFRIHKAR